MGEQELDAAVQIARHQVGAAGIDLFFASVAEIIDAAVLEEATDNASHRDVFTDTRQASTKAAEAAHDEIDLHARARGFVQELDHLFVFKRVGFRKIRWPASPSEEADLPADEIGFSFVAHGHGSATSKRRKSALWEYPVSLG